MLNQSSLAACSLVLLTSAACATASAVDSDGGDKPEGPDAAIPGRADATPGIRPDANTEDPPDAAPPPADAMPGCTPETQNLLANADFDLGPSMWTENSGGGFPLITMDTDITGVDADSGAYVTWLGGYVAPLLVAEDVFSQNVSVPVDATPIVINGKIWIDTAETLPLAFDVMDLELVDTGGTVLESLETWSNLDAGTGWVAFSESVNGNYAGQTVQFRLTAAFDASKGTSFLLDTLSMTTNACP